MENYDEKLLDHIARVTQKTLEEHISYFQKNVEENPAEVIKRE